MSLSEPMRINPNQSEKRFESCLLKNAWKLIRLNPRLLSEWIRSQFSIRINWNQSGPGLTFNPNESTFRLIRIHSYGIFGLDQSVSGFILIHSDRSLEFPSQCESIRTNPKNFWISFVENRLKIYPTQSETSIRMNPKESEVNFLSEWIRINPDRIDFQSEWISVRTDSVSFGLKIYFGFIRIEVADWTGLSQVNFQAFFNKRDSKRFSDSESFRYLYPSQFESIGKKFSIRMNQKYKYKLYLIKLLNYVYINI